MRVLATGTFDPHLGHASFLRRAARLGDEVYVGVLSDEFVRLYKGAPPLFNEEERAMIIQEATGFETFVVGNQRKFFLRYAIENETIIAVGSDWHKKNYMRQIEMTTDELEHWGITLAYVPYTQGISFTEIKERLHAVPKR